VYFVLALTEVWREGVRIYHSVIHYKQQKGPGRLEVDEARKGGGDVVTIWSQDRSLCCEDRTGVATEVNKHWLRAPALQSFTRRIFYYTIQIAPANTVVMYFACTRVLNVT